jgi:hypothetical protein
MIRPVADRSGLERRLAQVEVVLHNQDNREHDLLDSDDYYQFQGGLAAAVERVRGSGAALWFGDHSRSQRPRVHRIEKEFDKVLRSRVLNPSLDQRDDGPWLQGRLRDGRQPRLPFRLRRQHRPGARLGLRGHLRRMARLRARCSIFCATAIPGLCGTWPRGCWNPTTADSGKGLCRSSWSGCEPSCSRVRA